METAALEEVNEVGKPLSLDVGERVVQAFHKDYKAPLVLGHIPYIEE